MLKLFKIPSLENKSLSELEAIGASLNSEKADVLQVFKTNSGAVQDAIASAIEAERAERNKDPEHRKKSQKIG